MISRERKILRISQAHLAPGMSLVRWQGILASYATFPADNGSWDGISDAQVDVIFNEIAGIVKVARAAATGKLLQSDPGPEVIQPVDLYRP